MSHNDGRSDNELLGAGATGEIDAGGNYTNLKDFPPAHFGKWNLIVD